MAPYKNRSGRTNNRVHSDNLSRGQKIYLAVMSMGLVIYIVVQLIRVSGI
jgi:hypothetical protein